MTRFSEEWWDAKQRNVAEWKRRAAGLPEPVPEYRWHPVRKFRADYALPLHRVLIEIHGGLWVNGGHSRGRCRRADR